MKKQRYEDLVMQCELNHPFELSPLRPHVLLLKQGYQIVHALLWLFESMELCEIGVQGAVPMN